MDSLIVEGSGEESDEDFALTVTTDPAAETSDDDKTSEEISSHVTNGQQSQTSVVPAMSSGYYPAVPLSYGGYRLPPPSHTRPVPLYPPSYHQGQQPRPQKFVYYPRPVQYYSMYPLYSYPPLPF